jgi:hypothetical protein
MKTTVRLIFHPTTKCSVKSCSLTHHPNETGAVPNPTLACIILTPEPSPFDCPAWLSSSCSKPQPSPASHLLHACSVDWPSRHRAHERWNGKSSRPHAPRTHTHTPPKTNQQTQLDMKADIYKIHQNKI